MPKLMSHDSPITCERDYQLSATATSPPTRFIEDDNDNIVVGHPCVERVLQEGASVRTAL